MSERSDQGSQPQFGSNLDRAYDLQAFREQGGRLIERLAGYLEGALDRQGPVLAPMDPEALLAQVEAGFPRWPDEGKGVLEELLMGVVRHSNHVHHPGFVGHQVSAPLPQAILAEMVGSLLSNGMAVWEMGQLQTVMERRVVEYLCGKLGWPSSSDGVLTSGGSLGNLTALLAARQAKAGYDVWAEGQREPMSLLVSEQAHYCISRSVQCMGWGAKGAAPVPTDDRFRLRPEALEQVLKHCQDDGRQVLAVVASCCSTAAGSFDPLPEIADFCEENNLWLHVDGAHGASLCLSEEHKHTLRGIERADSVVWDLHKMMALPALNTAVLFREGARSYEPFAQSASYLYQGEEREQEWFQIGRRTMECTKRGLSITAYCMLQSAGTELFAENVERLIRRASDLADRLQAAPDFELATYPEANILCFRHLPEGESTNPADLDAHQARIRAAVLEAGDFYITQARLNDKLWMRVTISNPFTSEADLDRLIAAIREAAQQD
ncbi:MAG: L-2,4-diaminobutyrate decarboxylase [Planctomycetota bacterium]|jgi:L-2,4-diaminobutyrate decarboxylase